MAPGSWICHGQSPRFVNKFVRRGQKSFRVCVPPKEEANSWTRLWEAENANKIPNNKANQKGNKIPKTKTSEILNIEKPIPTTIPTSSPLGNRKIIPPRPPRYSDHRLFQWESPKWQSKDGTLPTEHLRRSRPGEVAFKKDGKQEKHFGEVGFGILEKNRWSVLKMRCFCQLGTQELPVVSTAYNWRPKATSSWGTPIMKVFSLHRLFPTYIYKPNVCLSRWPVKDGFQQHLYNHLWYISWVMTISCLQKAWRT